MNKKIEFIDKYPITSFLIQVIIECIVATIVSITIIEILMNILRIN